MFTTLTIKHTCQTPLHSDRAHLSWPGKRIQTGRQNVPNERERAHAEDGYSLFFLFSSHEMPLLWFPVKRPTMCDFVSMHLMLPFRQRDSEDTCKQRRSAAVGWTCFHFVRQWHFRNPFGLAVSCWHHGMTCFDKFVPNCQRQKHKTRKLYTLLFGSQWKFFYSIEQMSLLLSSHSK